MKNVKRAVLAILLCLITGCAETIEKPAETNIITTAAALTATQTTETATVTTAETTTVTTAEPQNQSDLQYIAMINVKHGGYVNFDDEYVYYVNFDKSTPAFDENTLCKRRLDGTGDEIVLVDEDSEVFYQKIHAVNVWNGRVYFSAIPTPQDYADGTDGFVGYLLSADVNGGDVRTELRDYFGYCYMVDGAMIYSIATEMEMPSEWYRYDFVTKEKTAAADPFDLPEPRDGCFPDYRCGDYVIFSDYSSFGKNLFVMNTTTGETTTIEEISSDEDRYVSFSTIYNGKLYYYITEGLKANSQEWHLRYLNVYDFETKTTEKVHGVDYTGNEHFNWNQLFLYSVPNGLIEYNADGKLVSVDTSGWHSGPATVYEP